MSSELKGLYRLGGAGLVFSGLLFLVKGILDYITGAPPSSGAEIIEWIESHSLIIAFESEIMFFATLFLVPGVIALYQSLAGTDRAKAATGCGIIGVVIPILSMMLIVHGRLIYPVYGIHAHTPDVVELIIAVFYGGQHAVALLMAVATFILSLAMIRGVYGRPIAWLGFATAALDIAGSYPYAIGPVLTLVCQVFFAAWFVSVGWKLYDLRPDTATA